MGPFEKEVMSQSPSKVLLLPQSEISKLLAPEIGMHLHTEFKMENRLETEASLLMFHGTGMP